MPLSFSGYREFLSKKDFHKLKKFITVKKIETYLLENKFIKYSKKELGHIIAIVVDKSVLYLYKKYERMPEAKKLLFNFERTTKNYFSFIESFKDVEFFKDFYVRLIIIETLTLLAELDNLVKTLKYAKNLHPEIYPSINNKPFPHQFLDPKKIRHPKKDLAFFIYYVQKEDLPLYINDKVLKSHSGAEENIIREIYLYRLKIGK